MQNKLGFIIISEAQLILFKDNNTNLRSVGFAIRPH